MFKKKNYKGTPFEEANKTRLRGTEKEWYRIWRYRQELDMPNLDDDYNDHCNDFFQAFIPYADLEDQTTEVHVIRKDKSGNILEEYTEKHFYKGTRSKKSVMNGYQPKECKIKGNPPKGTKGEDA